ncbi:putative fatty acyl-CoA reductase CG5065 [Anoplophora glabripennis]|uniref:putative fatty acyl-CoA reductase CG5065 n=1 Tax=Anoplophora glabripennis TaxID=217634 RepID=UPI000874AF82|nr:putative fatty acyl-CoA reductase CG5065 [Anoplophora glabripennis]
MPLTDFFKDKCIFITGGSGFIGRVLIEKLLRSCHGLEKIYVLLREKKSKTPEKRIKEIVDCELFDTLKKINPAALKKLIPICGDVSKPKLGLTEEDTKILTENVDIIYHAAASVRFDDHLKEGVLLNTRGTKEVVDIALQAKKLITLVHISTSYCNSDRIEIDEKLYPPHADWRSTIALAEQIDQHTLNIFSPQYIHPLPNTYTFAKSLSEHVVNDLCKGKLLATIVRPSIVIPSIDDPMVGWVDNFNGPLGLLSAGGKGILKISYGDENTVLDCIPVDILVKFLLLITYKTTLSNDLNEVPVYNATADDSTKIVKTKNLIELGANLTWDAPYSNLFWYPSFSMTNNWYKYYFLFLLYHMVPAMVADGFLKAAGAKPMFVKIQRKIYVANMALIYFMRNTWKFKNEKSKALQKYIEESEIKTFSFAHYLDVNFEDVYGYYLKAKIATSRLLFHKDFNREKGFRITMILWIMDNLLHITVFGLLSWYFIAKLKFLTICSSLVNSYIIYLNEL